jgi:membrane protein implicated in regulation of membrane protease activity
MSLLIGGTLAYLFLPSPWWVLVVLVLAGVEVFEVMLWLRWRRRRSLSGPESLIGQRGVLAPGSRVRLRGTSYRARASGAEEGDRVVVEDVDGLTLVVRRA